MTVHETSTRPIDTATAHDLALLAGVILIGFDSAITLAHWQYEANPVVIALGPALMVGIKSIAATVATAVWFGFDLSRYRTARVCAWFLFGLHTLVAAANVTVVLLA
ncbi:glutathione S-transferase family protein [Haloarcula amylovorans]|uniref:hypothetical protein n=1 Tax=Haloarcula amylovorans TaxID=2562280 RepID=UPI0010763038|nr:hypothetical protein [Halomicroarcula amylolytica]